MCRSGVSRIRSSLTEIIATGMVGRPSRAANLVPSSSLTRTRVMLRIILEFDDVVVAVVAAHQVRLRASPHPTYLFQRP